MCVCVCGGQSCPTVDYVSLSLLSLLVFHLLLLHHFSQKKLNSPVAPLASAVRAGKERLSVVNVVRGEEKWAAGGRVTLTLRIGYTLEAWNYREIKTAL